MNLLRVVPLTAFEFVYYDLNISLFNFLFPNADYKWKSLLAGCFSGGFAYTTVYPIDFARTMIAMEGVPKNITFLQTFSYLRNQFGFLNMFKGLCATWCVVFPYVGLKFYFFELFKNETERYNNKEIGELTTLFYGGLAGCFSTILTYPLDVLRRRR